MQLTEHAQRRVQQRGTTDEVLSLHEVYADIDAFVGSGCISRTLSTKAFQDMIEEGVSVQAAERARKRAIVYSADGSVITVLLMRSGSASHYRRGDRKSFRKIH